MSNVEILEAPKPEPRKIPRVTNFDIDYKDCEPEDIGYIEGKQWKVLDNGYLTVKSQLGRGGFCKVKRADRAVKEETGEKESYI